MSVAVIQGASGALGLALSRHILRHTNLKVYALTHKPTSTENELSEKISEGADVSNSKEKIHDRLSVLGDVDVREERGLERAATIVKEREGNDRVRLIACMAGILHTEKSLSAIDPSTALSQFQINTLGHLLTYKHFVPLIPSRKSFQQLASEWASEGEATGSGDPAKGLVDKEGSLCWSMSARVGSIGDNERGGWYSYRASKAAVNQIVRTLDHELINKSSSAIAVGYHPGTVITPFTAPVIGDAAPEPSKGRFSVDQAIEKMVAVMRQVRRRRDVHQGTDARSSGAAGEPEWGGRCWDWKGEKIKW
ncbi:rossman fold oxidoreductase [Kwoniella heveanensis BCC8398]|uniref:Rossman fold oxidoreductase n=1 Tax=Kwoniella heveanensis BCC8398 TaxID=1296120 RepID=A0A1B9GMH9_9TREE|nr:rossman fold oxidoreductase [Kwoniella heveanensis BCC8398]